MFSASFNRLAWNWPFFLIASNQPSVIFIHLRFYFFRVVFLSKSEYFLNRIETCDSPVKHGEILRNNRISLVNFNSVILVFGFAKKCIYT